MNNQLLIVNANIITLDDQDTRAQSLLIENGRVKELWLTSYPPKEIYASLPAYKEINLHGKTVIPGFIDTHNHLLTYSLNKPKVDCSSPTNKNIEDILQAIAQRVSQVEEGEWIEGYGYDDTFLEENRHPTKADIDRVAPNHPVYIKHISSHFGVANTKALELAKLDATISNPQGGSFGRDATGELNGVLYEFPAMNFVQKHVPTPTVNEMVKLLEEGAQDYIAQGITTNTDAGVGLFLDEIEFDAHIEAAKRKVNPMRTQLMIMHHLLKPGAKFGNYTADELNNYIQAETGGLAKLDSAKLFQDGSIQGMTAALREPYYNNQNVLGELMHDQNELNNELVNLHHRGYRLTIHGNGDRAIESILDGYEYALNQYPRSDHRHRIEHVQTATSTDLDRMMELGVAGSIFINHVYYWGDRHREIFLGPERAAQINPLADIKNRELLFTLHSDCPITPISPLFSIWAAVNRKTRDGEVLGENQRIDVITALKAMTIYGAQLNFSEEENGSIEKGKFGDLAILSHDLLTIDPIKIKDIEVIGTIINGEVIYDKFS